MTLDPAEIARMRWRCRRGLLELDLVLVPFVDKHYASLSEAQKVDFDVLLDLPDNILWDKITGKEPADHAAQESLLELMNAS